MIAILKRFLEVDCGKELQKWEKRNYAKKRKLLTKGD